MKHLGKFILMLAVQAGIAAQSVPASIEGIVTDQLTGSLISKVTLDLQSTTDSTVRYPAITASDGRFDFRNVLPGRYSLTAIRTGYVRSQYGQRGPNGNAVTILVTSGQRIVDVRMWMLQSGVISGRLTDVEGEPVPDAQVHAWKISYRDGFRTLIPVDSQASNDLGEYRLFGLPPGQYYVTAQPEPRSYIRSPVYAALGPPVPGAVVTSFSAGQSGGITDPATSNRTGKDYAPVYYGGTTDQFMAAAINLPAGTELRSMDIVISRETMGKISGTMVDASTGKTVRARVTVTPVGPNISFATLSSVNVTGGRIVVVDNATSIFVGATGEFESSPLPRGKYLLTAYNETQGIRLSGQSTVDLRDSNTVNVRMVLSPAPDIAGTVEIEGRAGANEPDIGRVKVGLRSTVATIMDVPQQPVSATGAFTLRYVTAGDLVANISPGIEKGYVKSIQMGNVDVLNDGLNTGNLPDGGMRIVIGTNPGAIAGVARDENGGLLSNVTVALLPDEYHSNRIDLYQNAITDAAGGYRFDRVPPGTYRIFAWEDVEKDAWRNPAFMRLHENRGKGIIVGEGASGNADLDVIRIR